VIDDPNLPILSSEGAATYHPNDANLEISKPIYKYYQNIQDDAAKQRGGTTLKYFQGQDMELHYAEKQLSPQVEQAIKEGFFEIKKKFNEDLEDGNAGPAGFENDKQVYVSHLCLHNFHPIFCKFNLETVKLILHYSSIVYLNKQQPLFETNEGLNFIYIILFGKLRLYDAVTFKKLGSLLNLGWTVGEEILFGPVKTKKRNEEMCKAVSESCLLAVSKDNLAIIKKTLQDQQQNEEFVKLEVILRGNFLIKKQWIKNTRKKSPP
jgi:hypothetical protein